MLVSVFETAVFCLYSDIFKTKNVSKSQILEQTSKFYFQQGQSVEKKLLLFPPLFCIIYSCLFIYTLPLYVNFNAYNFLLLVHSGQVIPNPNEDAK